MNKKTTYIAIGGTLLVGAGVYAGWVASQKQKDKRAAKFLDVIIKKLDPEMQAETSKGLDPNFQHQVTANATGNVPPGQEIDYLSTSKARLIAHKINDRWGWWDDDEEGVKSDLSKLDSKLQVSQVSNAYQDLFDIRLNEELIQELDCDYGLIPSAMYTQISDSACADRKQAMAIIDGKPDVTYRRKDEIKMGSISFMEQVKVQTLLAKGTPVSTIKSMLTGYQG